MSVPTESGQNNKVVLNSLSHTPHFDKGLHFFPLAKKDKKDYNFIDYAHILARRHGRPNTNQTE